MRRVLLRMIQELLVALWWFLRIANQEAENDDKQTRKRQRN
jgi:hypothetical protein